ncbi:hypothetical protein Tco_0439401 [Tanacetum coccineum]
MEEHFFHVSDALPFVAMNEMMCSDYVLLDFLRGDQVDDNAGRLGARQQRARIFRCLHPDDIAAFSTNSCLVKKGQKGPSHSKKSSLLKKEESCRIEIWKLVLMLRSWIKPKIMSASEPSYVGTLAPASTSGHSLFLGARDAEYDQILDDDFGTATHEEWNGPYAPERSILCKDIFKDPDVCRKDLDRTITPAELRRPKSLLPLELSNHVNVLSTLLVSHGYELNSRYANLVSSKAYLQEKLDKKKWDEKIALSERDAASEEVKKLQSQLTDAKTTSASLSEELTQTDAKLSEQALTVRDLQNELVLEKSKSQGYKDAMDGLREEVTQFVGSGVESLVRKLLSSDEFHAALARVASLGINYGVERGLRMGRTDVEFEAAVQKVSNFHAGAKADFDKALVDFPTTPFPFLSKIAAASGGTLSDVAQILPDKFVRSATSVSVAPSSVNEAPEQVSP